MYTFFTSHPCIFSEEIISHLLLPWLQSFVALANIEKAPLIQGDTQTATQQETPEIKKS